MKTVNHLILRIAAVFCMAFLGLLCSLPVTVHIAHAAEATAKAAAPAPVKIMPLGDSITYGTNSSNGGGYRLPLWNDLISQGANVDFVGSQEDGPENFDADNEGHPGWRIDQISTNIVNWLTTYQPQIILLHIGTNDIIQNYDVADAPTRLSQLINQITTTLPTATLFVAQITPLNSSLNTEVVTYNAAIPSIVQAAGSNVHLVDMYDAVSPTLLTDNIHPNDVGYGLMANVWHTALLPFLHLNSQSSAFSTNFEDGSPQPTSSNLGDTGIYPAGGITNVTGVCCGLTAPELGTRNETPHSGTTALLYSGGATNASGSDFAYLVGFDVSGLNLVVGTSTTLSYWIYPQSAYSNGNNSTCVSIDLIFSGGSNLRDSGALDQHNNSIHPASQCNHLTLDSWNEVIVNLGTYVNGKTIERIDLGYDHPNSTGGYRGYIDDLSISPSVVPAAGVTYELVNRNSGQVLDVSGGSTSNGGTIIQYPAHGGTNQLWQFVSAGSGYFTLINVNSGLALEVPGFSTANGVQLDQWGSNGGTNQQWSFTSVGGGYYTITNRNSGLLVDVSGASTAASAIVLQWPGTGGSNQQWVLSPVS